MTTKKIRDAARESREWLAAVVNSSGLKIKPFAERADLSPSSISRALDPEINSELSPKSIRKICDTYHVSQPSSAVAFGLSEPELIPYDAGPASLSSTEPTPDQYQRIVNTRALELTGFMIGDIIDLDMSREAIANDIVDAQIYSPNSFGAQTVLRLYDPPYLVTRSTDPAVDQKPHLVDNERVRIAAIVTRLTRLIHK